MAAKLTTSLFIEKANKVHNNTYDYSKVEYLGSKQKVEIICKKHGSFFQTPNGHLSGEGCRLCSNENTVFKPKMNKEDFIKKALEHHNYDYSNIDFKDMKTPIKVLCKEHGAFHIIPAKHLGKRLSGCPHCLRQNGIYNARSNTLNFIEKANIKHNNQYDYSKVKYSTSSEKVEIICKKHGSFFQTPAKHLYGNGCPHCSNENLYLTYADKYKSSKIYFYVIYIKNKNLYKIGITKEADILDRYKYETSNIANLELLTRIEFNGAADALLLESKLKSLYNEYRYYGKKIFKKTRNTEIFTINVYNHFLEGTNV